MQIIPAALRITKTPLFHRAGTAWAHRTRCAPLSLAALLLIALAPPACTEHYLLATGLGQGAAAATTLDWAPQCPFHQGLHLLPGTHFHDYGALPPLDLGNGQKLSVSARVDLSWYAPPVGDQGYVPSCTAWAATYTLVGWYIAKEGLPVGYMAPMYTYHRVKEGGDNQIPGLEALAVAAKGMVPMRLYPQGNYDWRAQPSAQQLALAQHWYVLNPRPQWLATVLFASGSSPHSAVERMNDARYRIEDMLARGEPALIELEVYENLDAALPQTAWIGLQARQEKLLGLHDLVAIGYDNAGLWVENSWGTGWGLNGYAELSWDYVQAHVQLLATIDGVRMTPGVSWSSLTPARPTVVATIVKDGTRQSDQTAWRAGEEVVWTGSGFQPGETVSLFWDGRYRAYLTVLPEGIWSVEWYNHPGDPIGPHNLHPSAGVHGFAAVGGRGDHVALRLVVR
jgi:hypothetical protein